MTIKAIITKQTMLAGKAVSPGDVVELSSPYLLHAGKAEKHDEKTASARISELKGKSQKKRGKPSKTEAPKSEGAE